MFSNPINNQNCLLLLRIEFVYLYYLSNKLHKLFKAKIQTVFWQNYCRNVYSNKDIFLSLAK